MICLMTFGVAFMGASDATAQNNFNDSHVKSIAKKAASDAGCLDGQNGRFSYNITFIGGCACGPATTCAHLEVIIYSYVKPEDLPFTTPQRFATVTVCGSGEVTSVTCD